MIRKTTALFLILIANMVLLVHAVVPHHHHQSVTCIAKTHCSNDKQAEHDHEHDGAGNTTTCVLKQAVIIPSSLGKFFKNFDNCADHYNHDIYFLSNFDYKDVSHLSTSATPIPDLSFQFTPFICSSLGLRAPPMV